MYTRGREGVDKYAAMHPLQSNPVPVLFSLDLAGNGTEYTDSIRASFSGTIRVGIMDRHVEHIPHSVIVPLNGSGLIYGHNRGGLERFTVPIKASHQYMKMV